MSKSSPVLFLLAAAAIFAAAYGSIMLVGRGNSLAPIWPANALLLTLVLAHGAGFKSRCVSLLFGASALLLADWAARGALPAAAAFTFPNLVEVVAAAWLLSGPGPGIPDVMTNRGLVRFLALAAIVAPALSATVAATMAHADGSAGWAASFANWYTSDALGMAVVAPLTLTLTRHQWTGFWNRQSALDASAIFALLLMIVVVTAYYRLLFFLVVPITLVAAFRLGVPGAAAVMLVIALVGSIFIVLDVGVPVLARPDLPQRIIAFQVFLAANLFWALPVAAVTADHKRLLAAVSSDNIQLRNAGVRNSQMLTELRRNLVNAEERERLRLARELHDETGQVLAATMLELKQIEPFVAPQGRDRLHGLRRTLGQVGQTVHSIAWQLRPTSINDCGLVRALENYVGEWKARNGVEVYFHCAEMQIDLLPEEVRLAIYRVVQEALTNTSKHAAGTTMVTIVIERVADVLQLTIEDDGCGFDPTHPSGRDQPARTEGLGLAGMRERLALLEGEITVQSRAGAGTAIFARIPLRGGKVSS